MLGVGRSKNRYRCCQLPASLRLQHQLLARRSQPHGLMSVCCSRPGCRRNGRVARPLAEPRIRQKWPLRHINPQKLVCLPCKRIRRAPEDTRATRLVKPNPSAIRPARGGALCSKQYPPRREATVFSASTARRHPASGARPRKLIKVFKRDGRAVRRDQPAQRRQARLPRASIADPVLYCVQVEMRFRPCPLAFPITEPHSMEAPGVLTLTLVVHGEPFRGWKRARRSKRRALDWHCAC